MDDLQMNESLPAIIKNPFLKTKVTSIRVIYRKNLFNSEKWEATGTIEFENGQTSGSQDFEGNTFDEVVLKIKAVLNDLQ